jgi:hypothetical protein
VELTFNIDKKEWIASYKFSNLDKFGVMEHKEFYRGEILGLIRHWQSYGFSIKELQTAIKAMLADERFNTAVFNAYGFFLELKK